MSANVQSSSVPTPDLDEEEVEGFDVGFFAGFVAALDEDGELDDLEGDLDDDDDDFDDDDDLDDDDEDDLDDDLIDLDDEYDGADQDDRPMPGPGRNDD
jgi:hypothetical protein